MRVDSNMSLNSPIAGRWPSQLVTTTRINCISATLTVLVPEMVNDLTTLQSLPGSCFTPISKLFPFWLVFAYIRRTVRLTPKSSSNMHGLSWLQCHIVDSSSSNIPRAQRIPSEHNGLDEPTAVSVEPSEFTDNTHAGSCSQVRHSIQKWN